MRILITTDLHINMKADDEYRWAFLGALPALIDEHDVTHLLVLGDLTHDKDKHPSVLVNRLVGVLTDIAEHVEEMWILKGNHDYVDPANPFFQFLNHFHSDIHFIVDPYEGPARVFYPEKVLMLPHTRTPAKDWKKFKPVKWCFMHQTVTGAVASNGAEMIGEKIPRKIFDCENILSGDIHVPQTIKGVTYVGTPYHVHFGDAFHPRLMLIDVEEDVIEEIPYDVAPRKISLKLSSPDQLEEVDFIRSGDFVKVQVQMPRSDFPLWKKISDKLRAQLMELGARERGIEVKELKRVRLVKNDKGVVHDRFKSIDDYKAIELFAKREKVTGELLDFGRQFL